MYTKEQNAEIEKVGRVFANYISLVPKSASEEWQQHSDRQYPDLLIFLLSCLLLLLRKLSAVAIFLFVK